ncbi:DgyrCDS14044 [Dimorphilus gyrociliatus]|uniref:DgyrCDS14044 n=1 Tax=Dimorphilus gyrociliatus TaxID=2664684 RepID=A0A7I8WCD8_9ANNE|nr:DgyrCDS14044 [Dimorphilus gyrociliatus]
MNVWGSNCCRRRSSTSCNSRRSSHGKTSLPTGDEHWKKVLQANETKCSRPGTPTPKRESGILSSLYAKFCKWVATNRAKREVDIMRRQSISPEIKEQFRRQLALAQEHSNAYLHKCCPSSLSSEDSDFVSFSHTSRTSSSLTIASSASSPVASVDPYLPFTTASLSCNSSDVQTRSSMVSDVTQISVNCESSHHRVLSHSYSCPGRKNLATHSLTDLTSEGHGSICATWPPLCRKSCNGKEEDEGIEDGDPDESVFEDNDLNETIKECTIPYNDLEFGKLIRVGRRGETYRGRYYGDVIIHTYRKGNAKNSEEIYSKFLKEVSRMCMIRHDNIALFMGACIDHPNLAIVTGMRKGISVYEQIRQPQSSSCVMTLSYKLSIAKQVSQAMGYLHARGIPMKKLNSKNVFLESKVKLCLNDYGMAEMKHDKTGYGCIPNGHLTYVAPEMMRSLRVIPPKLVPKVPYTAATDIYSFGTLLYEMMSGCYPYRGVSPETVIWQVSQGKRQSLSKFNDIKGIKTIIKRCWYQKPEDRADFAKINHELQKLSGLLKRRSSSEPDKLHALGLTANKSLRLA